MRRKRDVVIVLGVLFVVAAGSAVWRVAATSEVHTIIPFVVAFAGMVVSTIWIYRSQRVPVEDDNDEDSQ